MKIISTIELVLVVCFLFSCDGSSSQKSAKEDNVIKDKQEKLLSRQTGILVVDMLTLKQDEANVDFYDDEKSIRLSVNNEVITFDNDTCFYYQRSCDDLIRNCLALDLEFDLFILSSVNDLNTKYEFYINNTKLFVDKNEYLKFETYKTHLSNYLLSLDERAPLRKSPTQESEIIPGYEDYEYDVVEFKGEWLKLKSSSEYEEPVIGWVRWIDHDSLLINPIYVY